jgi:DNA repair protein RadC
MPAKSTNFPISDWAEDDKPREKLMNKGKAVLSDAELIAILIGSGSRNESAVSLSQRILASVQFNLNDLGKLSLSQLLQFKGIGEAKAVTILAALELGRRRKGEETFEVKKITHSKAIFEIMQPHLGDLSHEEFWVVYLNNAHKLLTKKQICKGGLTQTMVDIRLIFKEALEQNATAIILVHNHPSGNINPSEEDFIITKKIKSAGEQLQIKTLDHIIITQNAYYSFIDNGKL